MKSKYYASHESGYGKAGFKALGDGLSWRQARSRWKSSGKNSLWVKGALRSFRSAGGFVPSEILPVRQIR